VDHEGVGFRLADNEIDLKQAELMIDWCAWVLEWVSRRGRAGVEHRQGFGVGGALPHR